MRSTGYEVGALFPREMPTKMMISYLLKVEKKNCNLAQMNLKSTLNFYQRYIFDATISTEKSTCELDANLAQNEI